MRRLLWWVPPVCVGVVCALVVHTLLDRLG